MNQEDEFERKRFRELSNRSSGQSTYIFTNFLNMNQGSLLRMMSNELGAENITYFGGFDGAERVIARFGCEKELGYQLEFPITCIHISPLQQKFAQIIGHRDVLGAILNLGIERELIGDINIKGQDIYVYTVDHIVDFIIDELTRINRTPIKSEKVSQGLVGAKTQFEEVQAIIASERIDVLVAHLVKVSRSKVAELFASRKIFVNGKLMENYSYILKKGDIISIRGYGKVIYDGAMGQTKKERIKIGYRKYR